MTVSIAGTVENTPPDADAGADRTVECTGPSGADVTLDATGSTDRENNIVSYGWFLHTRAGDDLGSGPTLTLHQAIGSETYFVKPVDAFMQVDEAAVTIEVADQTGPVVACNAPATITPRRTPYSFTATATDVCDSTPGAPLVVGYECFAFNSSGKRVTRKCKVQLSGSTFTVIDSGGIGDHFRWSVQAVDTDGNTTLTTCETEVVRPGPGPV
jgi:hypothetical protein